MLHVEATADRLAVNTLLCLIRDGRNALNDPTRWGDIEECLLTRDIKTLRVLDREICTDDPYSFKWDTQITDFLKRYRFQDDLYTEQELIDKNVSSFLSVLALNDDDSPWTCPLTVVILEKARKLIAGWLGPYDSETHMDLCRSGRRATQGVPLSKACEAERWELPVSGTQTQISWFSKYLESNCHVKNYLDAQIAAGKKSYYQESDCLKLVHVPKSFRALRSIMPNTTIGSFMSYGLGEMMSACLRKAGYDIRKLQHVHRELARYGSVLGHLTTADLSHASDSISVRLVKILLPTDWFSVMEQCRVSKVQLPDGRIIESNVYATMGIGYTFPLETMVLLALLQAIRMTSFRWLRRSSISVYGDDMIYPTVMHKLVCDVFEDLRFVINLDKTFHDGEFRESCGGDYFRGVDVRPFSIKSAETDIVGKTHQAYLYKLINGLRHRWLEVELRDTLSFLLSELSHVSQRKILVVPHDSPDDSGVKGSMTLLRTLLGARRDVLWPKHVGHGVFRFKKLKFSSNLRKEYRHVPYYWMALRRLVPDIFEFSGPALRSSFDDLKHCIESKIVSDYLPTLLWREEEFVARNKRVINRLQSFVTVSNKGRYTNQIGFSCFE